MDIGKILENGWKLFVRDVGPLVLGTIIAAVLSVVSLGILWGPLHGGLMKTAVRRVREDRTADYGDVFGALDRFWTLFGATLLMVVLVGLGLLFLIIPGLLLAAIWFYVYPLIIDKRMGVFEAMSASKELVTRNGLGVHVAMVVLIALAAGAVSSMTGGIGGVVAAPLAITVIVAAYFTVQGDERALAAACSPAQPSPAAASPAAPTVEAGRRRVSGAPGIDQSSGVMAPHCSQCGASLAAGSEFCHLCGVEVSGGHEAHEPVDSPKASGRERGDGPPPAPPAPPASPALPT